MSIETNQKTSQKKVAIIGSGPAGYTAAIYAARAGFEVTIFLGKTPGGQLTTTTEIENFPGFPDGIMGPKLMDNMEKQAIRFGAKVEFLTSESVEKVLIQEKIKFIIKALGGYEGAFDAIVVATGASARYLGIPGEQEFIGKGYHTCATCDGFFYRGKTIAVVGGGDSAMEEASYLSKLAKKVYLIHRNDNYKASNIMKDRVFEIENIERLEFQQIDRFIIETDGKFAGVKMVSTKEGQMNEKTDLKIDGLFVAIGHIPNSTFLDSLKLDKDELGYLIPQAQISPEFRTSKYLTSSKIEGIFIAGDIEDKYYRQAITAAAAGCKAAMDLEKWLEE
jgi:thioredoxin reductase (NADPH)